MGGSGDHLAGCEPAGRTKPALSRLVDENI
jgi:hypothetical protein